MLDVFLKLLATTINQKNLSKKSYEEIIAHFKQISFSTEELFLTKEDMFNLKEHIAGKALEYGKLILEDVPNNEVQIIELIELLELILTMYQHK